MEEEGMIRRREIGTDGLFEAERTILDHWDAGSTIGQIVAATGRTTGYVRKTILTLHGSPAEEQRAATAARRGTMQLLAAIVASGGRFA
jgi:hypothetical protein